MTKTASAPRSIRFPADLWEKLSEAAEAQDRTPSNMVVALVRAALTPRTMLSAPIEMSEDAGSLLTPGGPIQTKHAEEAKPSVKRRTVTASDGFTPHVESRGEAEAREFFSRLDKGAYLRGGKAR